MSDGNIEHTNMTMYNGRPTSNGGRVKEELDVYDFLDRLHINYSTICHDAAYTMEECMAVERRLQVPICKNLFLCNRQQTDFYLLLIPSNKIFKTKYLSSQLGCARLSFATDAQMWDLLHIHPGSVSPMGLINDTNNRVSLIIDKDLLSYQYFGCHPCINTATLKIAMADFLQKIVVATKHKYTIVELPNQ